MTKEQRAALDALPPKRRAFVLAYVGECAGNATAAATVAGYAKAKQEGSRLLTFADVSAAVGVLQKPALDRKVMGIDELREFWTEMAQAEAEATKDRLKASELLGKSQGAFVERVEHSGKGAALVAIAIKVEERDAVDAFVKGNEGEKR